MPSFSLVLQIIVDGIANGAILALLAVGLSVIFRLNKFVNVAHVDMATVGAYATLFIFTTLIPNFWLAATAGVAVVAAIGYLSHKLVYRRLRGERSITLIIASIGVAFILRYLITFIWGSNQQSFALPLMRAVRFGDIRISPYDLVIVGISLAIFIGLFFIMRFTSLGRSLRAVADNPQLARVSGLRTENLLTKVWLAASALAGIGGVLLAVKTVITPYLGWTMLLPAFAAMIFGGVGSIGGTFFAALIIGIVSEFAAMYWLPTYRLAAIFGVIVLVLIVRPQGLLGIKAVAK